MRPRPDRYHSRYSLAFSLTELLVVISIMVLLSSAAVPALSSLMESNELTRGGQMVADQIRMARQIASSRNVSVEVRLVKTDALSSTGYNAVQLWTSQLTGTNAASRMISLPKSIAISENPSVSDMLGSLSTKTMSTVGNPNASYTAFQIRPSGMVSPTMSMNGLCLTVVSTRHAKASDALPSNYVTVQINPNTGTPLVYRP